MAMGQDAYTGGRAWNAVLGAACADVGICEFVLARGHHDLQQHLNTIQLYLGLLEAKAPDPSTGDIIVGVRRSAESLSEMFTAFSDLGRLEMGIECVEPERVMIADVANESVFARAERRIRNVRSSLSFSGDPYYVRRILSLLVSIIAERSTDRRILVGARRGPGSIRIEVWTNGPSVTPEELAQIDMELASSGSVNERVDLRLVIAKGIARHAGIPFTARRVTRNLSRFAVTLPAK